MGCCSGPRKKQDGAQNAEEPQPGKEGTSAKAKAIVDSQIQTKRGCTDILCLIFFLASWVVFLIVTIAGLQDGDPAKLYRPRDFMGAYCGVEGQWNDGPSLVSQEKRAYTMNVSAVTDQIAKQLMCSTASARFLRGPDSPLSSEQQDEYACACCLDPCASCVGSLAYGKGGDQSSAGGVQSVVGGRMGELTAVGSGGGSSLFDPSGLNGEFASNLFNKATENFVKVCLPSCGTDFHALANNGGNNRSYTYQPMPSDPLHLAWTTLQTYGHSDIVPIATAINTSFTFAALPASVCPYHEVYCVPFPGIEFDELANDYCGFKMSAEVMSTVGESAGGAFQSLGGNAFASASGETLGTWMGGFMKSIDSFFLVAILSFVIGLLFLVVLRYTVGICVRFAIVMAFVCFVAGGGVVFVRSGQCADAGLFDSGKQVAVAVTVAGTTAASNAWSGGPTVSEAMTGDGADYRGVQQYSRSGYHCKDWSLTKEKYQWPPLIASAGLTDNFCRNPYNETFRNRASTIWCYTNNPFDKDWELCTPVGVIQPECRNGYAVEGETSRIMMKICAVVLWVCALVWVILVCCFWSRIKLAIGLNQTAAQFVANSPTVLLVPIAQALVGVLWILTWFASASFLLSQVPADYTPTASYGSYAEAYGTEDTPGKCTDKWPTGGVWRDEACAATPGPDAKCWRCHPPRYIFDVRFAISFFIFLWNNAMLIAIGQCVIAGAVGVWFFTPNDEKAKVKSVRDSVKMVFKYHLGSLAFGAFILAVVQFIRYLLMYFEQQAKAQKNRVMALILKVTQYLLKCLERFIKFLNKNAYIQVALKGTNFCTSAKNAFKIITSNPVRFAMVAILGRVVHFLGFSFILMSTTILGYFVLQGMHPGITPVVPVTVYYLIGYVVGTLFMNVFGLAVDTCLQCFITSETMNHDGSFVPPNLKGLIPAKAAWDGKNGDKESGGK